MLSIRQSQFVTESMPSVDRGPDSRAALGLLRQERAQRGASGLVRRAPYAHSIFVDDASDEGPLPTRRVPYRLGSPHRVTGCRFGSKLSARCWSGQRHLDRGNVMRGPSASSRRAGSVATAVSIAQASHRCAVRCRRVDGRWNPDRIPTARSCVQIWLVEGSLARVPVPFFGSGRYGHRPCATPERQFWWP
jgi:hypothetical protein